VPEPVDRLELVADEEALRVVAREQVDEVEIGRASCRERV